MKTIIIFLIIIWLAIVIINLQKLNLFLVVFIILAAAERFWETFLSARHNILDKNSKFDTFAASSFASLRTLRRILSVNEVKPHPSGCGKDTRRLSITLERNPGLQTGESRRVDWLFKTIGIFYVILMFGTVLEFVYFNKEPDYGFMVFWFFIFSLALVLRLAAVRALGGVLDTSIFGRVSSPGQKKLVRRGPYKYLRHPIYLGTILECLSIPLIFSSQYTFLFVLLFCIPLLVLRAYLEERESVKIFGQDYLNYRSEVFAFFPLTFGRALKNQIKKC